MPIYTKTGDSGETGLIGGRRVYKSDLQVQAYGNVDELSAFLGLLIFHVPSPTDKELLTSIQKDLYMIMAYLAGSPDTISALEKKTREFEKIMDLMDAKLPKLTRFVIPQGTQTSSYFHISRTICRRAERYVVAYMRSCPVMHENLQTTVRYLNRLSDLLFMLSRTYNATHEKTI